MVGESSWQVGALDHDLSLTVAERVEVAAARKWNCLFLISHPEQGEDFLNSDSCLLQCVYAKAIIRYLICHWKQGFPHLRGSMWILLAQLLMALETHHAVSYLIFQLPCVSRVTWAGASLWGEQEQSSRQSLKEKNYQLAWWSANNSDKRGMHLKRTLTSSSFPEGKLDPAIKDKCFPDAFLC